MMSLYRMKRMIANTLQSFWSPNLDEKMTGEVATTLHQRDHKIVGGREYGGAEKV